MSTDFLLPYDFQRVIEWMIKAKPESRVECKGPKRSIDQNKHMWWVLHQLTPIDWYGQHLTEEDWKNVITSKIKGQRSVPGIDGGFVVLAYPSSEMTVEEMSDVIEVAYCIGAQNNIRFIEKIEPTGRMR